MFERWRVGLDELNWAGAAKALSTIKYNTVLSFWDEQSGCNELVALLWNLAEAVNAR